MSQQKRLTELFYFLLFSLNAYLYLINRQKLASYVQLNLFAKCFYGAPCERKFVFEHFALLGRHFREPAKLRVGEIHRAPEPQNPLFVAQNAVI